MGLVPRLGVGKKYHVFFFLSVTIHYFITILCHVGFSILQVVWALQQKQFPFYKDSLLR